MVSHQENVKISPNFCPTCLVDKAYLILVVIVLLRYLSRTHAVTLPVLFLFSSHCVFTTSVLPTLSHNMLILVLLCPPLSSSVLLYNNNSVLPPRELNLALLPADALFYLHGRILFLFTAIWLQNALQHDTTTNNLLGIIAQTQIKKPKLNIHL